MMYADNEKLEIHLEKDAQVKILTQRSQNQEDDRGEEDTTRQKLKFDLFIHYFTKIKNDTDTVVGISYTHCPKTYK